MILNMIHSARIGDSYLFAADVAVFWLAVASAVALAVGVAWLANRPMPVPAREAWHQETERRRWAASERHWARVRAGKRRR